MERGSSDQQGECVGFLIRLYWVVRPEYSLVDLVTAAQSTSSRVESSLTTILAISLQHDFLYNTHYTRI
jgi:hypothetical protein